MALPSPAEMYLPQRNEKNDAVDSVPVCLPFVGAEKRLRTVFDHRPGLGDGSDRVRVTRIAKHVYRNDRRKVCTFFAKVLD